jgi:hypothetical protein
VTADNRLTTTARRRRAVLIAGAALLSLAATALAQRGLGRDRDNRDQGPLRLRSNAKYDGRFTFVRINYDTAPGGFWAGGRPSWSHGYPVAERNLMQIRDWLYVDDHCRGIQAVIEKTEVQQKIFSILGILAILGADVLVIIAFISWR